MIHQMYVPNSPQYENSMTMSRYMHTMKLVKRKFERFHMFGRQISSFSAAFSRFFLHLLLALRLPVGQEDARARVAPHHGGHQEREAHAPVAQLLQFGTVAAEVGFE